jgi:hypothetical protein
VNAEAAVLGLRRYSRELGLAHVKQRLVIAGLQIARTREASPAGRRLTCAAACGVKIGLLFARHNPHRGRILALSRAFGFFDVELVQRGLGSRRA